MELHPNRWDTDYKAWLDQVDERVHLVWPHATHKTLSDGTWRTWFGLEMLPDEALHAYVLSRPESDFAMAYRHVMADRPEEAG